MRRTVRTPLAVTVMVLATAMVAGCATPVRSPAATTGAGPGTPTSVPATPARTEALTAAPEPTPVESAPTLAPEPTRPSTTNTDWGVILDGVPPGFPVYPGASGADISGTPVSGAWLVNADVDEVAIWYRNALEETGFTTQDLSSALENGSRVLDTVSDLPECRIQSRFQPADGSTIILVLYGAGCAGFEG